MTTLSGPSCSFALVVTDEHQFPNAFLYTKQCFGLVERMNRQRALRGEALARCKRIRVALADERAGEQIDGTKILAGT